MRGVFGGRSRGESGRGSGLEFRTEGLNGLRWAQWGVLPRDAFEEVTDPTLLLLLRVSQQQQLFGCGHVVVHCRVEINESFNFKSTTFSKKTKKNKQTLTLK